MSTATSPQQAQIERLLQLAQENGASEVRLSGGYAPMLRLGDQMRPLKTKPLAPEDVQAYAAAIMPPGADAKMFSFTTPVGSHTGSLLEVQGTKVLVLRVAGEAAASTAPAASEAAASGGGDIQLDIADEPRPWQQAGGDGLQGVVQGVELLGAVQCDNANLTALRALDGADDGLVNHGILSLFLWLLS